MAWLWRLSNGMAYGRSAMKIKRINEIMKMAIIIGEIVK